MATKKKNTQAEVREAEMLLAGMIQNANAFGMDPWQRSFYGRDGQIDWGLWGDEAREKADACCALGAYYLHPEGLPDATDADAFYGIASGNDGNDGDDSDTLGAAIGRAFQDAMGGH